MKLLQVPSHREKKPVSNSHRHLGRGDHVFQRWFLAVGLSLLLTTAGSPATIQASSSPAPLLLVTNSNFTANPFGMYLGEILRAEGLNEYDNIDLANVDSSLLSQYPVVILAQTSLTSAQASLFSNYVNGGGQLIAMRPDAQIAGLFGLAASAGSPLADGYLQINSSAQIDGQAPGEGLVTDTLQIHGKTDIYNLAPGAVILAQLYNSASSSTAYPAVVSGTYGSGRGIAFLYDLAKNVVYMRQGNPNNATYVNPNTKVTGDVDGDGIYRTIDLFQTQGGGAPWVNLNKVPIPQADEQMRLFSRLVKILAGASQPLPQLWYFPGSAKTMLIMTGDSHANPDSYFQNEIASINNHHGEITIYISIGQYPTDSELQTWETEGHTFGIHPYASATYSDPSLDITNLQQGYQVYTSWWPTMYSTPYPIPMSKTVRNHQVAWAGYADAATYAENSSIYLDTSFYDWGAWLKKSDGTWANGYITGSGLPMYFAQSGGNIVPVFQQLTELVDEQFFYDINPNLEGLNASEALQLTEQMINSSLGGYYSALVSQNHVDYYGFGDPQVWAEGMMDYANSVGVPIWNADRWYNFTQVRHDASYTNVAWNATSNELSFNLNAASSTDGSLTTILPLTYGSTNLQSVTVDGSPEPFTQETINGVNVAFVSVPAGNHSFVVAYTPPPTDADLSITQSAAPATPVAGEQIVYTLNVENSGPAAAPGVTLTDALPANTSLVSYTPNGACSGTTTITCNLGTIDNGNSATVTLTAAISPAARNTITNLASVSSSYTDPVPGNNSTALVTPIDAQADLSITVKPPDNPVVAGNALTYTLTASNAGPSSASNVQISDSLPAGLSYQSASGPGWTCLYNDPVVTCTRTTLLSAGASASITLTADLSSAYSSPTLTNAAAVSANETDTNPTNNSTQATNQVTVQADLGISVTPSAQVVGVDQSYSYLIEVVNDGPNPASNVSVTDTLPSGVTLVGIDAPGWSCSTAGQTVTCSLPELAVAAASDITLQVKAPQASGEIANQAQVSSDQFDPNQANNLAGCTSTVFYFTYLPMVVH